jgi:NAD(P)-dependent dehydrogenase (short-subunit alcohol dehydrogenase family)
MLTSLEGKVAVVTGASRGLGLAIAQAYAKAGAAVVLAARSQASVEGAAADLNAAGLRAAGFACDVTDLASVEALAAFAVSHFGGLDIWVNNAGIADVYGPTAAVPSERFAAVLETNIFGTYHGSLVAMRHFAAQNYGKLINLLGRGDSKPVKYQNAYASSKAWVRSFTLGLAQEYKDSNIGVFAFNPGLVDTAMLRRVDAIEGYEEKLKPLSFVMRLWAQPPEKPAERALWLASSATDGKTGKVENVLSFPKVVGGLLGEAGRRITRKPAPDTSLQIIRIPAWQPD